MNPFDTQVNGLNGLDGFSFSKAFKKVKNAVKKVDQKLGIDKVKKAVGLDKVEKATDKAILQTSAEIQRSPIAQAALVVGAGIMLGPAAIALAKGAAGKIAASGALKTVIGGAGKLVAAGAKTAATTALTQMAQNSGAPKAVQEQLTKSGERVDSTVQAIANDPQYAELIASLRSQGYSDQEIAEWWAESQAYREAAVPQIAQTVYPQVYSAYTNQGYSPSAAQDLAVKTSDQVAENAVNKLQGKTSGADMLKIGIPIALLLFSSMK